MKRISWATLLTLALVGITHANESALSEKKMLPLSTFTQQLIASHTSDFSNLAYIGNRSGMLFTAMASFMQANSNDERDQEIAKKLMAKAQIYLSIGNALDLHVNNKSKEVLQEQLKMFLEIYSVSMVENKQLNNSFISPLVSDDLKAANSVFPVFEQMAKDVKEGRK